MARVVRQVGSVEELHALDPFADGVPDEPQVWWCDPVDSAIVLGSRQSVDLLDSTACDRAGLAIVRRRSGGGAVLIRRGEVAWIDLVVPHGVAPDDVRGSMLWAGERCLEALGRLGHATTDIDVHREGMVCTPWSGLVCFAGFGPGELVRAGAKLVGLSQRRTRRGLRLQTMVHRAVPVYDGLFGRRLPDGALTPPALLPDLEPASLAASLAGAVGGVAER